MKTLTKKLERYYFKHSTVLFDCLTGLICLWSFSWSVLESTFNEDFHHWGLMYVPALELKQGLVACKDVLIYYGVFTSWIQSIGLSFLGENLRALGITTGLFHSLNLLLLYQIFKSFISKQSSFFAVVIVFLLHSYIVYPWPNYFTYTFELLAVITTIKLGGLKRYLLTGLWIGLAILSRYSSVQAVLPPFVLFFIYQYVANRESLQSLLKRCILFLVGVTIPLLVFFAYLIANQGLDDFILSNVLTLKAMVAPHIPGTNIGIQSFLPNILFAQEIVNIRDSRTIFLSVLFALNLFIFLSIFIRANHCRSEFTLVQSEINRREAIVCLISIVTLFGYLNGLNLYEVFRVVNGSSIGVGLIFYCFESPAISKHWHKFFIWLEIIVLSVLCWTWLAPNFQWSSTLMSLARQAEVKPANVEMSFVKLTDIKVLEGKVVSREYYDHYTQLKKMIDSFDPSWPIVNYSVDTIVVLLDPNRPRLQKSPAFFPAVQAGLTDEIAKIEQATASKRAILVAGDPPFGYGVNNPASFWSNRYLNSLDNPPPGYRLVGKVGKIWVFAPNPERKQNREQQR